MYCVDIMNTIGVQSNATTLGTRNYSSFSSVQNKSGLFIFFDKTTNDVLYIGSSTALYLTSGGPGAVAQLINTSNPAIYNYFLTQNPTLTVQNPTFQRYAYDNYINNYSVFFLCLTATPTNQNNFQNDLADIVIKLKSIIQPIV